MMPYTHLVYARDKPRKGLPCISQEYAQKSESGKTIFSYQLPRMEGDTQG